MHRTNALIAVVLFVALTLVVTLQVVNRLVLHLPIIWSEEAARFLFFWVVLLGAALSVRSRRHFVLDVVGRRGSGAVGFLLAIVPNLAIAGFALFLLVEGVTYTQAGALRTATNSGVPMSAVYAAIPVFAALAIGYAAVNLRADHRAFMAGRTPAPPDRAGE